MEFRVQVTPNVEKGENRIPSKDPICNPDDSKPSMEQVRRLG